MAKNARKKKPRSGERDNSPGLAVRRVAADIVEGVLNRHRALDEMLEGSDARAATAALAALDDRDRGLTRAIVAVVLRRLGTLRHLLGSLLEQGLPAQAPRVETALLIGAAQILFLDVPDHAAVDLAVRLAREDRKASHFAGLVNAVLRRIAREGKERIAALDAPVLDTPPFLMARWTKTYGEATAHDIAAANGREPALDLTVKSDAETWAAKLDGRVLPTGTVRAIVHGAVTALPGFDEGAWWVQDAAAALPARLLGDVAGLRVADLCAAPGGKTAQLVVAGANVTAVDRAPARLKRLQENLTRLVARSRTGLRRRAAWTAEQHSTPCWLDAPCSATGTIRRHPDVPWLKRPVDITSLAAVQRRLLDRAVALTKPGGTASSTAPARSSPRKARDVVADLLAREQGVRRVPITAAEVCGQTDFITPDGDLRTLPCHLPGRSIRASPGSTASTRRGWKRYRLSMS